MVLSKKVCNVLIGVVALCFFLTLPSYGDCLSTSWPHETSDLTPDPSIVYGRLDNGFRYILKKNQEPENRVAISLYIQAGSLHEDDDQRGIAHFLEHMLFNGSTHFSPGKLVEYFQSIGMSFGGDTNAHTGYDETVYDIILPLGSKEHIQEGLLVVSDYARGALLLPEEINRERGVILSEKRSRDSAGYRAQMKELDFSMEGTKIPERVVIGVLDTLNKADHTIMKRFYDAWYRPENMVLVMVGDFDPAMVKQLVEKQFATLQASGPVPTCPDIGFMLQLDKTKFFYHHEPEMGKTETAIETHWNIKPQKDSIALEIDELHKYMATKIIQHRLDELAQKSDTPFTNAHIYSGIFLKRFAYGEINAECDPEKWQQSLTLLENTLRQALQYGFSEEELQRVKKEILSDLESAVLTQSSRNSKALNSSIVRSLNRNRVFLSPEQELDLFRPVVEKMSVQDVEKAFHAIWSRKTRLVKVNGNAVVPGPDPLKALEATYNDARKKEVAAYTGVGAMKFPYLQLPASSKNPLLRTEELKDVGGKRMRFANGVILNIKQTDFQENEVQLLASFGQGKSGSPIPGLSLLADAVIGQSGTGRLSKDELANVLSGSSLGLTFRVGENAFQWQAKSLNRDMELSFQVLQHLLADPGVDQDAFVLSMDRLKQYYDSLATDVRGAMKLQGDAFLAGENKFFGIPPWEEFQKLKKSQLEEWFVPAAKSGALEISLVGDFDEEKVIKLAQKYFGVLPERSTVMAKMAPVSFPAGENLTIRIPSSIDKGMVVVAWKTDDFWDIQRTRALHILAEVFTDKLRKEVREKLGASYGPQVFNVSSRVYDGYGVLQAVLIVDPSHVEMLKKVVLQIADKLWQGEISETELENAKGPMLTSLKDMVRTNRYWLQSVLALSSRYPQQLQWPNSILSGFAGFSVEDIKVLAKRYLKSGDSASISVIPEENGHKKLE